jgi:hypothetical protein
VGSLLQRFDAWLGSLDRVKSLNALMVKPPSMEHTSFNRQKRSRPHNFTPNLVV